MADRKTFRTSILVSYLVLMEVIIVGIMALAIFSMVYEPVGRLRIYEHFDYNIQNLPAILAIVCGVFTISSTIPGFMSVAKSNQVLISVFVGLMVLSAFFWFGIASWCISLHTLIMDNNLPLWFRRLKEEGESGESLLILKDLKEYLPRINSQHNFECCQGTSGDDALVTCAQDCEYQYTKLFNTLIFPVMYSSLLTAGVLCILALLSGCFVCCYLDDVKPAL